MFYESQENKYSKGSMAWVVYYSVCIFDETSLSTTEILRSYKVFTLLRPFCRYFTHHHVNTFYEPMLIKFCKILSCALYPEKASIFFKALRFKTETKRE